MKSSELLDLTAAEAVRRFRDGTLSPVELTAKLIERIRETEPKVKAYVTTCEQQALLLAEAAEKALKAGHELGPLHGLPIGIKDLIETKGVTTTAGSRLLMGYVPESDAEVVARLKRAGGIIIGKTNTHEFALGGITPPTSNPWDLARIPGGSSGGSAAAIAAGSALLTLGSDTGGSIRIPASYCGAAGLKPTYGRVSRSGVFPESWSLDHIGPIAKTPEDCALLLQVIAGHDAKDPTSAEADVPDYMGMLRGEVEGLRLGMPENYFYDLLERGVRACVSKALRKLEGLGCELIPFKFPYIEQIMGAYTIIDAAEASAYHEMSFRSRAREYQPDVRSLLEAGYFILAVDYIKALRARALLAREVARLFERFDIVVTPTQPTVAPRKGQQNVKLDGQCVPLLEAMVRLCAPFNLLGLPALSIPCGFSNELPVGLQLVGRYFEEGTLLKLGQAYEEECAWHKRHPAL